MELKKVRILRGPNFWSNYRKNLIVLTIDLQKFEKIPSHLIPNFSDNLKQLIPSLEEHHCSEEARGGFFTRLDQGTWLGHVIEHVALELQWLAGMSCGFGRTRSGNTPGTYYVIFSYECEKAGVYAGRAAFNIVESLANQKSYERLSEDITTLKNLYCLERLGPSTAALVDELLKRKIPYHRLDDDSLLLLGQGHKQKLLMATETSGTSIISVEIAVDKNLTKKILADNFIPVPKAVTLQHLDDIDLALSMLRFPIVIKPLDANHGKGVICNIFNKTTALQAFNLAKKFSEKVLFEEQIQGADYRILVINFKVVAVAKREPAKVIGNGTATIEELIATVNKDPKRGAGHDNFLTKIEVDETTQAILVEKHLHLHSILPPGEVLYLKYAANISTGGTAEDVTDQIHQDTVFMAERIARLIHLDICGIDIIAKDIAKPLTDTQGAVIEVNSSPGFRMHLAPDKGQSHKVEEAVINMLYPPGTNARIPVIAVTGTNGKTTVVRLLAYLVQSLGYKVGYTTTDGIYIQDHEIYSGDCSGPESAQLVLRDPAVEFAILECARGGILRRGLGFDHCNISIVTNISEDHLGQDDILTLADLQRTKMVVPRSTFKNGYAILNADDDLVYEMKDELDCQIALFGIAKHERLQNHINQGGIACYLDGQRLLVADDERIISFDRIDALSLTLFGKATVMVKNLLPVVLAAYISQLDMDHTKNLLKNFQITPKLLPGRMNLFSFDKGTVLLDYAHNVEAYNELKNYLDTIKANKKIGIIAATGDRRDIDIINLGKAAGQIFDEIIIRHDKDGRGRTNHVLTELLTQGIQAVKPNHDIKVISNEFEALNYALTKAVTNSFIFYFPDNVADGIQYLHALITPVKAKVVEHDV